MTHVAEEGNRRRGDMTGAEIGQSVLDVESWFKKHARGRLDDAEGADDGDIQVLEKVVGASIPEELRSIMAIQDGQIWFSEKQAMTCKEMIAEASRVGRQGLMPFAKDADGSMLVTDAGVGGCPVWEWDAEGEGATVAKTFSSFLEGFRNELLSGRYEYIEELGVVEKIQSSRSPRGK